MNSSKKILGIPEIKVPFILKDYTQKVTREERYYFYEKNRGRLIHLNENFYADRSADIEETIRKQRIHKALVLSLNELNDLERQIIDECFFGEKVTYTELASRHGVTRSVYMRKVDRILKKLRVLFEMLYEEF